MKKIFLIVSIVLLASSVFAQNTRFPDDFIGNWKGELSWHPVGKPIQKVMMELIVQPSKDTAGQFSWNIIYGSPSKDNRPYILKPIDTATGHWMIDEVNGIILDQYWVGNKFCGAFSVSNSTIVNNYCIEKGDLIVEFLAYARKPIATTGKGTEESPAVDSYGIKSYQRAVLKKTK